MAGTLKALRVAGALCATALFAAAQSTISARPGVVNYVEGGVSVDGRALSAGSHTELGAGQVLRTAAGKAELLLTPGVFLRLGDHSAVRMISPGLADTRVELQEGEAMVEAAELMKENHVAVLDGGATATLRSRGLYRFDAGNPAVAVYDGKADVTLDDSRITVKKGQQAVLAVPLRPAKFDCKSEDALYDWSKLRSADLAQASYSAAERIVVNNYGWAGPGWYWSPWWNSYSFLPGAGFAYSPFGYGFYSPGVIYGSPVFIRRYPGFGRMQTVGPMRHGHFGRLRR
jgi:hypothetical protein